MFAGRRLPFHLLSRLSNLANLANLAIVLAGTIVNSSPCWAAQPAWRTNVLSAVQEAARDNKPMLMMVETASCVYCRKMHQQTFTDPTVSSRLAGQFIPVLIDADAEPRLMQQLGIDSFPTVLVVRPDLKIVSRAAGFQSPAQVDNQLASAAPRFSPAPSAARAAAPALRQARLSGSRPPIRRDLYNPYE